MPSTRSPNFGDIFLLFRDSGADRVESDLIFRTEKLAKGEKVCFSFALFAPFAVEIEAYPPSNPFGDREDTKSPFLLYLKERF